MIHYRRAGDVAPRTHAAFRSASGNIRFEHCFTRDGFDGAYSILYHEHPPQNHTEGTSYPALWATREERNASRIDALRRRHFKGFEQADGGTSTTGRLPLMFNQDLTVGVLHPTASDDFYFANGDGDDLFYIQYGGGTLISPFGRLKFTAGDYVFVPRAVAHRFELDDIPQFWFGLNAGVDYIYPASIAIRLASFEWTRRTRTAIFSHQCLMVQLIQTVRARLSANVGTASPRTNYHIHPSM